MPQFGAALSAWNCGIFALLLLYIYSVGKIKEFQNTCDKKSYMLL